MLPWTAQTTRSQPADQDSGERLEGRALSDERSDLILNMPRAIRAKQDEHDRKFDEVITRLSALERDFAGMKLDFAGMQVRLDNIGRRLDRVERRLDLVDERTP